MAGINETLLAADSYYYDNVAVPQNATVTGTDLRTSLQGIQGAQQIEVVVTVATDLTDTKVMTIALLDSADGVTFAAYATLYTITAAAGSGIIAAGTNLVKFVLPDDIKEYTRVSVLTDDADVEGDFDCYVKYLPR